MNESINYNQEWEERPLPCKVKERSRGKTNETAKTGQKEIPHDQSRKARGRKRAKLYHHPTDGIKKKKLQKKKKSKKKIIYNNNN